MVSLDSPPPAIRAVKLPVLIQEPEPIAAPEPASNSNRGPTQQEHLNKSSSLQRNRSRGSIRSNKEQSESTGLNYSGSILRKPKVQRNLSVRKTVNWGTVADDVRLDSNKNANEQMVTSDALAPISPPPKEPVPDPFVEGSKDTTEPERSAAMASKQNAQRALQRKSSGLSRQASTKSIILGFFTSSSTTTDSSPMATMDKTPKRPARPLSLASVLVNNNNNNNRQSNIKKRQSVESSILPDYYLRDSTSPTSSTGKSPDNIALNSEPITTSSKTPARNATETVYTDLTPLIHNMRQEACVSMVEDDDEDAEEGEDDEHAEVASNKVSEATINSDSTNSTVGPDEDDDGQREERIATHWRRTLQRANEQYGIITSSPNQDESPSSPNFPHTKDFEGENAAHPNLTTLDRMMMLPEESSPEEPSSANNNKNDTFSAGGGLVRKFGMGKHQTNSNSKKMENGMMNHNPNGVSGGPTTQMAVNNNNNNNINNNNNHGRKRIVPNDRREKKFSFGSKMKEFASKMKHMIVDTLSFSVDDKSTRHNKGQRRNPERSSRGPYSRQNYNNSNNININNNNNSMGRRSQASGMSRSGSVRRQQRRPVDGNRNRQNMSTISQYNTIGGKSIMNPRITTSSQPISQQHQSSMLAQTSQASESVKSPITNATTGITDDRTSAIVAQTGRMTLDPGRPITTTSFVERSLPPTPVDKDTIYLQDGMPLLGKMIKEHDARVAEQKQTTSTSKESVGAATTTTKEEDDVSPHRPARSETTFLNVDDIKTSYHQQQQQQQQQLTLLSTKQQSEQENGNGDKMKQDGGESTYHLSEIFSEGGIFGAYDD